MNWSWLGAVLVSSALACGSTNNPSSTSGGSGTGTGSSGTTGGTGLAAGEQCIADTACQSGVCDVNGAGNCCTNRCSTEDLTCGATDCDTSGACSYPQNTTNCGRCASGMLTPGTCDGLGICANPGTALPCPSHLGCNATGTACNSTCNVSTDCASGYYCSSNACVPQFTSGACAGNDSCASGFCGVAGSGHCCTEQCPSVASSSNPCGAIDCDNVSGACVFSGNAVICGADPSCASGRQINAGSCNGKGGCTVTATSCTPFICGPSACLTSCTDATSCESGAFCDTADAACCPGLVAGSTLTIDGLNGSDSTPCCGYGDNIACLTIKHAMQLIDNAGAANVTLEAVLGGGNDPVNGTWAPPGESYPIVLGWGAELLAPGITFAETNPAPPKPDAGIDAGPHRPATFDIRPYSANDTVGYASIAGTVGYPMTLGISSSFAYAPDPTTILVESGQTLYLANATINGDANGSSNAITVNSATLMLGQDRSGAQVGTVTIGQGMGGFSKGAYHNDGWVGIVCNGCTIQDSAALAGQTGVAIQGQIEADIQASDGSTITLTSAPIIGPTPSSASFNTCPSKQDGVVGHVGVQLNGKVTMTFENGAVQCIAGNAFDLHASAAGTPTLVIDHTTIQNNELGISAPAGTATVTSSTIQFNYNGVEQTTDGTNVGTVDLSGTGDLGGTNTVVCSSSIESIHGSGGTPGVDVLNTTVGTLDANNVAWDTPGPDLFTCDPTRLTCTCESGSCVNPGGVDGMDAVELDGGTITTTGNTESAISCVPICYGASSDGGGPPCAPGLTCCTTSPNPFMGRSLCLPPGKACH